MYFISQNALQNMFEYLCNSESMQKFFKLEKNLQTFVFFSDLSPFSSEILNIQLNIQ